MYLKIGRWRAGRAFLVISLLREPVLRVGPAMFYGFCLEGVGRFGVPKLEAAEKTKKNASCAPAPLARPTIAQTPFCAIL